MHLRKRADGCLRFWGESDRMGCLGVRGAHLRLFRQKWLLHTTLTLLSCLIFTFFLAGCGDLGGSESVLGGESDGTDGGSGSDSGDSGGDSGDNSGSSGGDSNDWGDDSGSSGGDSSSGTGFEVSGALNSLEVASLIKGLATQGTVTDIIAVTPATADIGCKTASVEEDGTFSMKINPKKPWYFYFFDRVKRGREMYMGRIQSMGMDTFLPNKSSGLLDLGTLSIDAATGLASSDTAHGDILTDLGLDSVIAETIGEHDDVARRYSNPDVDDDGEVDCGDSDKKFFLDFHVRFDMRDGNRRATISDIIGNFLDESETTADYTGTGIYVSYPKTFSSLGTGSFTFSDTTITTSEGGNVQAGTESSDVTTNNFGNYRGFGPNTTSSSELPSGEVIYSVGGKELTFSDVVTPSLEDLTTPTGRIFPFIKFSKSLSTCTQGCTLTSVSYQWVVKVDGGWEAASEDELNLLVKDSTGYISFRVDNDSSSTVGLTIPDSSIEGTIDWDADNAELEGVTDSEFLAITTSQICHLGLSYDDQLGMRYFQNIDNASGTCD